MWTLPFRVAAALISVPLRACVGFVHRRLGRRSGGLHLVVDAALDAAAAQAWVHRLHRVASDDAVDVVLLEIRQVPGGWATTGDVRGAIGRLRAAGKRVVAWVESPDNAGMWLASACDEVVVAPGVDVSLTGLGTELTFGAAALARFGVQPDFEAAGAYKSFGEPFTRTYASPESREATEALLGDLQESLVEGVALGRSLEPEAVLAAMREAPLSTEDAVARGLVDGQAYLDELVARLEGEDGAHPLLGWRGWALRDGLLEWLEGWGHAARVVVLHLEGSVVFDDTSGRLAIRARHVGDVLAALREDDKTAAVVLHVQSPGGSAHASDRIWRDVVRLADTKPVVACFGDVSASGGFYIAAPAHEIIARRETVTGSIGVFGGKLVVGEAMRKVGVTAQPFALTPSALMLSSSRRFDAPQRARFRASLQRMYDGFVERVASGRQTPVEQVEPLCRGRVWSGRAAAQRSLVDHEGDLEEAVYRAADRAGLTPGTWVRRDVAMRPSAAWTAVMRTFRQRAFAAARPPLTSALDGVSEEAWVWADTVARLAGTPMALLPFPWRVR